MILAMFLITGFGIVDMIYLGRFSKEAMAAVGLAYPVTFLLHTFAGACGTAATSLCSRLIGQGEHRRVRNLVLHVLVGVVLLAVIATPGGMLLLRPVLTSGGAAHAVVEQGIRYGTIYFLGSLFALLAMVVNALYRGEGDTVYPFKVMAAALAVNIVLDPFFIFGIGPFPRLGVAGAAVTTLFAIGLAAALVCKELFNPARQVRFDRSAWRFDPALLRDFGMVAGPAALANLSMPLYVYLINRMLIPFGTDALAAFGAGIRLLSFVLLPSMGISLSMMIMVGQNHGAGSRRRVQEITRTALVFSTAMLVVLAAPVALFPRWALSLFTDDQAVIAAGLPLARWVTLARPLLGVVVITAFWFQARGQGPAGMVPNILLRVVLGPLGVYLGIRLGGLAGGWYGLAGADALGGLLCLALLWWRSRIYLRQAVEPAVPTRKSTAPPTAR